jgi:hypothetical protein
MIGRALKARRTVVLLVAVAAAGTAGAVTRRTWERAARNWELQRYPRGDFPAGARPVPAMERPDPATRLRLRREIREKYPTGDFLHPNDQR